MTTDVRPWTAVYNQHGKLIGYSHPSLPDDKQPKPTDRPWVPVVKDGVVIAMRAPDWCPHLGGTP